jgi:hypothetical protein
MKTCNGCGCTKPIHDFYKAPNSRDGYATKCKECAKAIVTAARKRNADHYRDYDSRRANRPDRVAARAAYAATEEGKAAQLRARQKYLDGHPKRRKAHTAVRTAIRNGSLVQLPCFVCGEKAEAHHPDYDRPLDVVWLCPSHHREAHILGRKLRAA